MSFRKSCFSVSFQVARSSPPGLLRSLLVFSLKDPCLPQVAPQEHAALQPTVYSQGSWFFQACPCNVGPCMRVCCVCVWLYNWSSLWHAHQATKENIPWVRGNFLCICHKNWLHSNASHASDVLWRLRCVFGMCSGAVFRSCKADCARWMQAEKKKGAAGFIQRDFSVPLCPTVSHCVQQFSTAFRAGTTGTTLQIEGQALAFNGSLVADCAWHLQWSNESIFSRNGNKEWTEYYWNTLNFELLYFLAFPSTFSDCLTSITQRNRTN